MDWATLITFSLGIMKGLLAAATKSKLPQEFIDAVQAAIDAIVKVHSQPVTKAEVQALMADGPFGTLKP
jgi:hypothetical protein